MKRASYREGVRWIADNDESGDRSQTPPEEIAAYVSSILLADLFGVEPIRVGRDVARERAKQDRDTKRQEAE